MRAGSTCRPVHRSTTSALLRRLAGWAPWLRLMHPSRPLLGGGVLGEGIFWSFDRTKTSMVAQRQKGGLEILPSGGEVSFVSSQADGLPAKRAASGGNRLPPRLADFSSRYGKSCHGPRCAVPAAFRHLRHPGRIGFFVSFSCNRAKSDFQRSLSLLWNE